MSTRTSDVDDHKVVRDERVKERNRLQRLLIRPEMGAAIGAVAIFVLFLVVAAAVPGGRRRWPPCCTPARPSASWRARVAVLMIGGEFDLSAGVAVTFSSLAASMLAYNLHLNLWAGAGLALILALAVGFFNGFLVMKTKIPSFLITLSTLLHARRHQSCCDQTGFGPGGHAERERHAGLGFGAEGVRLVVHHLRREVRITVLWWLVFTAVAT